MEAIEQKNTNMSYKYVVLLVCSVFLGMVYVTLSAWGVSVSALQDTFSLSPALIMAGNAMLIAGYAIGSFVEGRMLGKFGWRKTFIFAMVLFLASIFLIPNMQNYGLILFLRFVQGFGLIVTITNSIVCSWFPTKQRGLASGLLLGFIALGVACGSLLTGSITPALGWQANFYILGIATFVGAIVFIIFIKDPPAITESDAEQGGESVLVHLKPGKSVFGHPIMILLGLAMFCVFFNVYGLYSFIAAYLYDLGYSAQEVGAIGFWNGFIGLISTPFGGWIGDYFIRKGITAIKARAYSMGIVAFLAGTIGCGLMPHLAPISYAMAIIPAIIAGWGCPAANGPICSLPSDVFGAKIGGGAVGFILLIAGAGGVIAPILVPWLAAEFGWTFGWYITALPALIGFVICFMTPSLAARRSDG